MMFNTIRREWPVGLRLFIHRCAIVPFETALALLAMWSGTTAFFQWTVTIRAMNSALPTGFTSAFNLLYLISGAFLLAGIGWGYRNIESSGLVLLFTVFLVRVITLVALVGLSPETVGAIVQALTFGLACLIRLRVVLQNKLLIPASDIPDIVAQQSARTGYIP